MTLTANFIFNTEQFRSEVTPEELRQYYKELCLLRDHVKQEPNEKVDNFLIEKTNITNIFYELTDYIQSYFSLHQEFFKENKDKSITQDIIDEFALTLTEKKFILSNLSAFFQRCLIDNVLEKDRQPEIIQDIFIFLYSTIQKIIADDNNIENLLLAFFSKKLNKYKNPDGLCSSSGFYPVEVLEYYTEKINLINNLTHFFQNHSFLFVNTAEVHYTAFFNEKIADFNAGKDVMPVLEKGNFEQFFKWILFNSIEPGFFEDSNKHLDIKNLNMIARYPAMVADGFFYMVLEGFYWLKNSRYLIPSYDLNTYLINQSKNKEISLTDFFMSVEYVLNQYENSIKQEHYLDAEIILNNLSLPQKYLLLCRIAQKIKFYMYCKGFWSNDSGLTPAVIALGFLDKLNQLLPAVEGIDCTFIFDQMRDMAEFCCIKNIDFQQTQYGAILTAFVTSKQFIHYCLNDKKNIVLLEKQIETINNSIHNIDIETIKLSKAINENSNKKKAIQKNIASIMNLLPTDDGQLKNQIPDNSDKNIIIIEQPLPTPSEPRSLKKTHSFYGESTLFQSLKLNNNKYDQMGPVKNKNKNSKLTRSQSFFCGSGDMFLKTVSMRESRVFDDIYPCIVGSDLYEWHAYRYLYTPSFSTQNDNDIAIKTKIYSYQFQLAINGFLNARDWYELHFKTKAKPTSEERSLHQCFNNIIGVKNYLKRKLGGKNNSEPVTYHLNDLIPVMVKTKENSFEFRNESDFNYYALSRKLVELFFKRYCNNGIIHAYIDGGCFIPDRDADKGIPAEISRNTFL